MRILVADDHDLFLEMLEPFLQSQDGFVVETSKSLPEACEKIKLQSAFDLVLLDYSMPGMNGLQGLDIALDATAGQPVAIMSGTANKAVAQEAVDRGAIGFLPKTMSGKSLVNAIRFMSMGETYIPLDFMNAEDDEVEHPMASQLSEREFQVLEGLCKGQSNKEIARDLDLQEVTVKLHVKTLCRKLDARNRTQAAIMAKEAGLF